MELIDKSAIVAEIEKMINEAHPNSEFSHGYVTSCEKILSFLDTLEVKEPTASDRGMAEEIIINLKRVEQDYRIDLTREMEWVRNKVKKGE